MQKLYEVCFCIAGEKLPFFLMYKKETCVFVVFTNKVLYNKISNNILSKNKEEYRYGNESNAKKSK